MAINQVMNYRVTGQTKKGFFDIDVTFSNMSDALDLYNDFARDAYVVSISVQHIFTEMCLTTYQHNQS